MANCPFCGSEKIRIETPYVETKGDKIDEYEPVTTYCCAAQRKNAEYIDKNFDPNSAPDVEDVSKL